MKCPICNLVEMFVVLNDGKEVQFECPKCGQVIVEKIVEDNEELASE